MQLGWAPAGPAGSPPRAQHRWDGVDQLLQQQRVVGVGGRKAHGQREAGGVDQQVVLGAKLAPVDRIRAGQFPPCLARTLTLSMAALDQSIWPSSPSQSSKRWCRASQTPAACQARSRRQQVTRLPQPSARAGNSRQGVLERRP